MWGRCVAPLSPFLYWHAMSEIDLQHPHALSPEQARAAVQHVADALSTRFGLVCQWQEQRLVFTRPGVEGAITLRPGALQVNARLGWMLSAVKAQIEQEIRRVLREKF